MIKKYSIVNDLKKNNSIDYFFYIVILFLITYLTICIINTNCFSRFDTFIAEEAEGEQRLTVEQELVKATTLNKELLVGKEMLEKSINEEKRIAYLNNNFLKISDDAMTTKINNIEKSISNIKLPESTFENDTLINTQNELNTLIKTSSKYKHFYKPGDIVINPSSATIDKNKICNSKNINNVQSENSSCMVCSVDKNNDYKNSVGWKNTKTNIDKVCIFNPNSSTDPLNVDYTECRKLCNL